MRYELYPVSVMPFMRCIVWRKGKSGDEVGATYTVYSPVLSSGD